MALSSDAYCTQAVDWQWRAPAARCAGNDAFSFWKLAETHRGLLEQSIAASEIMVEWYLLERYLPAGRRRPPKGMRAYYLVKKALPAALRHRMNAWIIRARRQRQFPAWPCESALVSLWREWLRASLDALQLNDAPHIGFWPEGKDCSIVLTHDVESSLGLKRIDAMADLEERYGFRSAWNLPLAQYPIDWKRMEKLRARGFELGAHGLSHDGKLFRTYEDFVRNAQVIERIAGEHGLRGFRSPSTLRCAEWIKTMNFDFDSSFSDTDPYEPQAGGTCSIFPFFLEQMIELPYTMPQDHTLIHLLRQSPLPVWLAKLRWIQSLGGMILTLVHPDYCGEGAYFGMYEELLKRLNDIQSAWRALPSEAASWWRRRAKLTLVIEGSNERIVGENAGGAVVKRLSEEPLGRWS